MIDLKVCLCWVLLFAAATGAYAQSPKTFKKRGQQFFATERYADAVRAYERYRATDPDDEEALQELGISYYFTNRTNNARRTLTDLLAASKRPAPIVHFYLARTLHAEERYEEAIASYKDYLRAVDKDSVNRPFVKDAIRRCAFGLRVRYRNGEGYVENLGEAVNSVGDDFKPIQSPNYETTLYFSSAREGNLGGRRNDEGLQDEENGLYGSDMFTTSVVNGQWDETTPMSYLLNSPRHDVVVDFSKTGDRLYYYKGYTLYAGDVLIDTFRTSSQERALRAARFESPAAPERGDVEMHLYNDTTLLFASRRAGGAGGLDLYITQFRDGVWKLPENLGPTINGAYDETSPFLSRDGRTLYFSSNRAGGTLGGLDIFRSVYDDATQRWSTPENLLSPVNSAGDDLHFRLGRGGYKGYFSSSRKSGLGKRDLYSVVYQQVREEQRSVSTPLTFYEVPDYQQAEEALAAANNPEGNFAPSSVQRFQLQPLLVDRKGRVDAPQNRRSLDELVRLHQAFPEVEILLTGHGDGNAQPELDLFFSIKHAEAAAAYLTERGVLPERILVRGVGSAYPLAKRVLNGQTNEVGERLNRRVDIQVGNTVGMPLAVTLEEPNVPRAMQDFKGRQYSGMQEGLVYRVHLQRLKQRYKGDLIQTYPHAFVERRADSDWYDYYVGAPAYYDSARQLKDDLIGTHAVYDAYVLPYVRGRAVTAAEAAILQEEFSDLAAYLETKQ